MSPGDEADTLRPTGDAHWPLGTSRVVCASLVVITSMIRPLPGREYLHRPGEEKEIGMIASDEGEVRLRAKVAAQTPKRMMR